MLNELKACLESEKNDDVLFDIVLYGSSVKGKTMPNDIDLIAIFRKGNLRERLDKIQEMKEKIKNTINTKNTKINIDFKQITIEELFLPEFFAKTGIILEGISLFKDKKFSEILGFKAYSLFWFTLEGLSHNEKVKFNYILAGRGSEGLISKLGGERLVGGAVKIPIDNSLEFEEVLKNNRINYKKKDILEVS